jgi:phosphoribosylaminoimidazole carboxylase (NCAIR synthetase)
VWAFSGWRCSCLPTAQVLINEISPRVHNAGHYTLEACASSQFEQHLRAVSGMPLSDTTQRRPGVMRNLLCTPALKHEDLHRDARHHPGQRRGGVLVRQKPGPPDAQAGPYHRPGR